MGGILGVVGLGGLVLLPPLFTGGACTAADQKSLATPALAQAYWSSRQVPISVVSAEQCRRGKPRFVEVCGSGVLVHAVVPVQNRICRFYRDDGIRVQLQYANRNPLAPRITRRNPF